MRTGRRLTLIGDDIDNPFNIDAMIHAAEMFDSSCLFVKEVPDEGLSISIEEIADTYSPVLALDNWKNSQILYGYVLPDDVDAALITGNERRGISHEMKAIATQAVSIPMISKELNCINVAAASAVGMYYLSQGFRGRMQTRAAPQKKRPEILFIAGSDHAELGSAIRSAAAFGWNRTFIEDRNNVWFGCDRVTRSQGRAAARRGRNSIRLVPCKSDHKYLFREAIIVTTKALGAPLHKSDLAKGPNQILVIADEKDIDVQAENWQRVADNVSYAQIQIPARTFTYHYRHLASIALAEASRQVGQGLFWKAGKQEPLYESSLKLLSEERGEEIHLEDLADY